jgi:hypothetical protein
VLSSLKSIVVESPRFDVGTIVDLLDVMMGWRGKYKVIVQKSNFELVRIQNLDTKSVQFVSAKRLRLSILPQFGLKSLRP